MSEVKFELVKWELSFEEDLAKNANNINIANNLRNIFPNPYTVEHAKDWIGFCNNANENIMCYRAILVDGIAVGGIGIDVKDDVYCKSAELGYWLGEDYWGNGIVTSAIVQIYTYVFENYDVVRIFAEPFARNIGSRRALEKAGFKLEGIKEQSVYKNDKIEDSYMYALTKNL